MVNENQERLRIQKMLFTPQVYIGIDPSRGRKAVWYAALDQELNLVAQGKTGWQELLAFIGGQQQAAVGVVGPSRLNQHILVDPERRSALLVELSRGRPGDMRVAEYRLKQLGLPVYKTPSDLDKLPGWMAAAIEIHQKLDQLGFVVRRENPQAENFRVEVVPEVCFRAWMEGEILPPSGTFGRLQRQLTLYDLGVNIPDPMDFFEEITRYKVLHGQTSEEMIYTSAHIGALAAAFLAWQAKNEVENISYVGAPGEGFICLPAEVAPGF